MTARNLQLFKKTAACLCIISTLSSILSFHIQVDVDLGRTHSVELSIISLDGSLLCAVATFTTPPPASRWHFNIHTKLVEPHKKSAAPASAPSPGWEDHNYVFLQVSTFRRAGAVLAHSYTLYLLFIQILLAIASGILWFHSARTLRRRRIWAAGQLCINCGYDLRATPELCPECGTKVIPGFEPLSWREPQQAFVARYATRPHRNMIMKRAAVLCIFLAFIAATVGLVMSAPRTNEVSEQAAIALCVLLAIVGLPGFFWSFSRDLFCAIRPPKIVINERGITLGPDPALLSDRLLPWKRIRAAEITHDPQGSLLLVLTVEPSLKARRAQNAISITRAIPPDLNLDDLRQRLAAWTPKPPPSAQLSSESNSPKNPQAN